MRISLVLGAGGARGYAHIGVINELLERGHEVVSVSGTSIGSLIGGAFAAGRLDVLTEAATRLSRTDWWLMMRPTLGSPGLIKTERIIALLRQLIGDVQIEDLPMPYTAVATDMLTRREIWFTEGPLLAAIRASIAIPSVFTPAMLHGRLLVDGALVNPLPMEPTLRLDADLTVAVSLLSGGAGVQLSHPPEETTEPSPGMFTRLGERIAEVLPAPKPKPHDPNDPFDPLPDDLDLVGMMTMALDLMQERIQASRVAVNPPDVFIEVPTSLGTTFDFADVHRIMSVGRELAIEKFDQAGL